LPCSKQVVARILVAVEIAACHRVLSTSRQEEEEIPPLQQLTMRMFDVLRLFWDMIANANRVILRKLSVTNVTVAFPMTPDLLASGRRSSAR
jgi:hypothetical protein